MNELLDEKYVFNGVFVCFIQSQKTAGVNFVECILCSHINKFSMKKFFKQIYYKHSQKYKKRKIVNFFYSDVKKLNLGT